MIKTVFFDFFGVVSSEITPFWFAERYEEEEAKRLKDKYMTPADLGEVSLSGILGQLSALDGTTPEDLLADFMSRAVPNRELLSIISSLKENYKVVLLSNALPEMLHMILARDDLYKYFDKMVISGEIRMIKPNRDIFEYALSIANCSAEDAVFIDDNPKNVSAAKEIGIHALRFESLEKLVSDLKLLGVEL